MDLNLDAPGWTEAARQFSGPSYTVEAVFRAPRDKEVLLGDAFSCELFSLVVSKRGAETDIIIRVFKSEAKNVHPAV